MPIVLKNDFGSVSLIQLQELRRQGYSVVKSPHVGNQHESNLVCAKLGFPLHLVTFTRGDRDKNFHPHKRIVNGQQFPLYDETVWTPFANTSVGLTARSYHASGIRQAFPFIELCHDDDVLTCDHRLGEAVLKAATEAIPRLWYRRVTEDGVVHKQAVQDYSWEQIADNVFGFSNEHSGYVVPNRAHILMDLVYQAVSSGRDEIYHCSGPQMIGYVGGVVTLVSRAYDRLRELYQGLPEVLTVHIVPLAECRFVAHRLQQTAVHDFDALLTKYEEAQPEQKRFFNECFSELAATHPAFTRSIEDGRFLSQYDLSTDNDLVLSEWMLCTPLLRVRSVYKRLVKASK